MHMISRYVAQALEGNQQYVLITRTDRPLKLQLAGQALEAQFEFENADALIFLSDNCPYEERLHVYLLRPDDSIQDALEAGAAYTPGLLQIIDSGADWVELKFFQNAKKYRLEIASRTVFFWHLPKGWRYKKRWCRHRLKLYEVANKT